MDESFYDHYEPSTDPGTGEEFIVPDFGPVVPHTPEERRQSDRVKSLTEGQQGAAGAARGSGAVPRRADQAARGGDRAARLEGGADERDGQARRRDRGGRWGP